MGFLLFAARKIQLKREINSKNYELMLITNKIEEATKAVGEKQQAISDMQGMINTYSSVFNSQLQQQAYNSLGNITSSNAAASQFAFQTASQAATSLSSTVNSIFSSVVNAQNKAELARLQAQEQSLETRKTTIETELEQLSNEYKTYDDAVKQSAKDAAPQFGLA